MALVARAVSATSAPGVTASRPSTVARTGMPSNMGGPVDSIYPTSGTSIGEGGFSVVVGQEGGSDHYDHPSSFSNSRHGSNNGLRNPQNSLPNPHTGVVDVTSQSFVSLLELRDTVTVGPADTEGNSTAAQVAGRLIGHAVALYEASIESAEGNIVLRGESVSLTL